MFFSDTSRNRYHKRLSFISISVLAIGMLIGPVIAIAFPSIVYAQQPATPPPAECKVDTIQFKHFEGLDTNIPMNMPGGVITYDWRKNNVGGKKVTLEITTSNCSGKKIAVSVQSNRRSGFPTIKELSNKEFPVEDGGGISMRLVVADEQCAFLTEKEQNDLAKAIADTLENEGTSFIQNVSQYRANIGYTPRSIGSFVSTFRNSGWQQFLSDKEGYPLFLATQNPLERIEGMSYLKNYNTYGWLPQEIEELDKIIKKNDIFVPSSCDYTAMARPVIDAVPGPYNPAPGAVPWVKSDRLKFQCNNYDNCRAGNTLQWVLGRTQQTVGGGAYLPSTSKCLDAQGNPIVGCQDLLAPLPGFGYTIGSDLSIGKYVNTVIKIVIGLMGIAAVFIIIGAGIEYMTSDSFGIKMGAKGKIQDAALGLAVIIGIYVILRTINPYLLDLNPDSISNITLSSSKFTPSDVTSGDCVKSYRTPPSAKPEFSPPSNIINNLSTYKSRYTIAANRVGIPWEMLAIIHFRESNFQTEIGKGPVRQNGDGGVFQNDPPRQYQNALNARLGLALNEDKFDDALIIAAYLLKEKEPKLSTTTTDESIIKNAFWGYNGKGKYQQNSYNNSFYVMNKWDESRKGMMVCGSVVQNGVRKQVSREDRQFGAFPLWYALKH